MRGSLMEGKPQRSVTLGPQVIYGDKTELFRIQAQMLFREENCKTFWDNELERTHLWRKTG